MLQDTVATAGVKPAFHKWKRERACDKVLDPFSEAGFGRRRIRCGHHSRIRIYPDDMTLRANTSRQLDRVYAGTTADVDDTRTGLNLHKIVAALLERLNLRSVRSANEIIDAALRPWRIMIRIGNNGRHVWSLAF
jgi:hypothetical protein